MRKWLGSLFVLVLGAVAVASGCGSPSVSQVDHSHDSPDASVGGASSNGGQNGTGASSGSFILGDGGAGTTDGCPSTCAQLNANCGFVTDTLCSGVIECGTCADGQFCGGDGANRCGTGTSGEGGACSGTGCMSCAPKTCADQGFTCGPAGDTCGAKLDCGPNTCSVPGWTCGGAKPGVCGCTGPCSQIPDCSASTIKTTSVSGVVYDPAGLNPLYHVFVYVANDPTDPDLLTFKPGVTCDVCGASAAGSPLVSDSNGTFGTYTDTAGKFKLNNVPVGKGITVVIQLGRWRRVFTVDIDKSCDDNPMPKGTFLMPSKQSQGNIPLIAMVTGASDSLECVLTKMGIDPMEFTNPAGGGRVQFYLGSDQNAALGLYGQKIDTNTPMQSVLFGKDASNQPVIDGYDMTILACEGAAPTQSAADLATLRSYAASGGRVFTSHYSFAWLRKNDANTAQSGSADNWSEVAKWNVDEGDRAATASGKVDLVSNPKGNAFQEWLLNVGASTMLGIAPVIVVDHDTDGISPTPGKTQQWLYRDGTNKTKCKAGGQNCTSNTDCGGTDTCGGHDYTGLQLPLHFTYNTPVNLIEDLTKTPPAVQCGRVLFSDFHVQDAHEHDKIFPAQCDTAPMNAQEKLLEYMIFDLGSCVPPGKMCVPATTCPAGEDCGYAPDGCGGLVACGVCPAGIPGSFSCNVA